MDETHCFYVISYKPTSWSVQTLKLESVSVGYQVIQVMKCIWPRCVRPEENEFAQGQSVSLLLLQSSNMRGCIVQENMVHCSLASSLLTVESYCRIRSILIVFTHWVRAHIISANPTNIIHTDLVPQKLAEVTNVMCIFIAVLCDSISVVIDRQAHIDHGPVSVCLSSSSSNSCVAVTAYKYLRRDSISQCSTRVQ